MAFHDPYIYIGDFGNNANKRKDLQIIKYHVTSEDSEIIHFSFPDQTAFPPNEKKLMNYDCEAMIWYDSTLVVFSKSKKNKQPVSAYRVPDQPGDYIAEKMMDIPLKGKVTGASYNQEQNLLYILTYGKIMAYKILQEQDRINLNPVYCKKFIRTKQSEAITAEPHGNLVITNEQRNVYVFTPKKK